MMLMDAAGAFQSGAGITPDKVSLGIRLVLGALALLWGGWVTMGLLHRVAHHEWEEINLFGFVFRVLLIIAILVALVAIA